MDAPVVQPPPPPPIQPVPPPPPKKNYSGILIGVLLLLLGILVGLALSKTTILSGLRIPYLGVTPTSTPIPSPTPAPDPTANWKTYKNQQLGISLKYPTFYSPIEKFTPLKSGEPIFIVTGTFNFYPQNISLCKTYQEQLCLIPGKNWSQEKDILPTSLSEKKAVSFFVSTQNQDGGNNVIHVIQTTEKPLVEVALTVDGMGGEETFQQILSTFRFINTVTPSPTQQPIPSKALNYSVPSGWITVQDSTESFTVSYDPTTSKIDTNSTSGLFLLRQRPDPSLGYYGCESVNLYQYDGGSRHQFIYKYLGETPTNGSLRSDYKETEYLYNGKSCLLLNGISISQFNSVWGMCDVGNGKAFLFTSCDRDITNFEKILQTIHVLK